VSQSVTFQQIGTSKGFGADLALIRLFLSMHAHVTTQVIKTCIALGALATGIQPGSSTWPRGGSRLGFRLLLPGLAIAGARRVAGGGGLILRARTLLRWFAAVLVDRSGGGGTRASLHLHLLGSPATTTAKTRANSRSRKAAEPIQSKVAWAPPNSSQNVGNPRVLVPLESLKWRESHDLRLSLLLRAGGAESAGLQPFERRAIRFC